jgi:transcriptional antiterminator RfaH
MMRWYVVHTQPQAETRALWHLRRQGFECFLPRIRKLVRHARKVEPRLVALFPRYLFVRLRLDAVRWRAINGTRGVVNLLANGDSPLPVPHGAVETLHRQCDAEDAVPPSALGLFTKGLKVRIMSGAFIGQVCEVVEAPSQGCDRVQLLLNFLGVQTNLYLPPHAIEAA